MYPCITLKSYMKHMQICMYRPVVFLMLKFPSTEMTYKLTIHFHKQAIDIGAGKPLAVATDMVIPCSALS